MIFYCTNDGIFWTRTSTTRGVIKAPHRDCPDCVRLAAWEKENEKEIRARVRA